MKALPIKFWLACTALMLVSACSPAGEQTAWSKGYDHMSVGSVNPVPVLGPSAGI